MDKVISKQTRATQISNFQLRENFCTTTSPDQSTTQSSSALTQVHREERITVNRRDTNGDNRIVVNRIGEPPPLVGLQAPMESCYRIDFAFTTTPQWSTCSDVLVTQDFFMGHLKNAMINTELKIWVSAGKERRRHINTKVFPIIQVLGGIWWREDQRRRSRNYFINVYLYHLPRYLRGPRGLHFTMRYSWISVLA